MRSPQKGVASFTWGNFTKEVVLGLGLKFQELLAKGQIDGGWRTGEEGWGQRHAGEQRAPSLHPQLRSNPLNASVLKEDGKRAKSRGHREEGGLWDK